MHVKRREQGWRRRVMPSVREPQEGRPGGCVLRKEHGL